MFLVQEHFGTGVRTFISHGCSAVTWSEVHASWRGCAQRPVPTAESSSASTQPRSRERGAHTEKKMDGVGSFGAGRTGSTVDPIAFAKQPQTILRVLSWVSGFCLFVCLFIPAPLITCDACMWERWGGGVPHCCRCCVSPWRAFTANMDPRNPALIDQRAVANLLMLRRLCAEMCPWNRGEGPDRETELTTDHRNNKRINLEMQSEQPIRAGLCRKPPPPKRTNPPHPWILDSHCTAPNRSFTTQGVLVYITDFISS